MKNAIRIFISSPGDVEMQRQMAVRVIRRLALKFQHVAEIKPLLWDREPLLASGHFQDTLDPTIADIMLCIFWSRLGSVLPERFVDSEGRSGLTGSE